jgi:3-deoxy-manno-octulosonate cytidylyltransferase (CMP-KDO synthetase)
MKILGVIPARYKSSRFEGKPLALICEIPMIIHVAQRVESALGRENFVIATDDNRISEIVVKWGYRVVMTSTNALTGTDRLWEVAQNIQADIYVNIQGDEPIINPDDILEVVKNKIEFPNCIINAYTQLQTNEDPNSLNIPKVVFNEKQELIYMSRLPIPGNKNGISGAKYYKQVCIYAFSYHELEAFGTKIKKTILESYEDIEILRFLEMGFKIKMIQTSSASLAVDVPEDIQSVELALKKVQDEI